MILRHLVTRFGFDVDKNGVTQYENTVKGMKRSATRVAGIFGLGFGAKQLWDAAQGAERAEFLFKRMAKTDFRQLRSVLAETREEMDRIREGSGNLLTTKEFDRSARRFLKDFGSGREQMRLFKDLWSFAARESAITGKNVMEIMSGLQEGIKGGDFGSLLELPGFDQFQKQLQEFQQQAIDPGEPGGRIAIQNRARAFLRIIKQAQDEQNRSLQQLPEELLEANKTSKDFAETMDKLSRTIDDALVPVLKGLNSVFESFNEKLDQFKKSGGVGSFLPGLTGENKVRNRASSSDNEDLSFWENYKQIERERNARLAERGKEPSTLMGGINALDKKLRDRTVDPVGAGITEFKNVFNITNQDPETTAAIVEQRMREMVKTARQRNVKTEDTE